MPNRFENLDVDDDDVNHDKNERKAKKKLKAIEKLKKKENLTDEEQKKIDSEDYLQRIVNPHYENKEKENKLPEQPKINKKRERQREKKRQKQTEEAEQREAKQRQREAEQREREAEQREREAEQREREAEQRERQRQRQREAEQRQEPKEIKTRNEKKIYIELSVLLDKGISFKKAKHNLLLKYHPDKNKGNTANEMTQIINNIVNK